MAAKPQICGSIETVRQKQAGQAASQLVSESTLNPLECHRMLAEIFHSGQQQQRVPASDPIGDNGEPMPVPLSVPKQPTGRPKLARSKELLELQWSESDADQSLALAGVQARPKQQQQQQQHGWRRCTCPTADWQQTRTPPRQQLPRPFVTQNNVNMRSASVRRAKLPNDHAGAGAKTQSLHFGCRLTRKKLLKQLALARVLQRNSRLADNNNVEQLHSLAGYAIERLLVEANEHLEESLRDLERTDLHKLSRIVEQSASSSSSSSSSSLDTFDESSTSSPVCRPDAGLSLIGIRLLGTGIRARLADVKWQMASASFASDDSGVLSIASEATFGSAERPPPANSRWKLRSLDELVGFRSSRQFRQIVSFSCSLFDKILAANQLLSLELLRPKNFASAHISLQQLKLAARVECQKVRAVLRFDWLLKCHWLAFESTNESLVDDTADRRQMGRLPSILGTSKYLDERLEQAYLSALDRLLGRLLRNHFLERALENWTNVIASQLEDAADSLGPKLVVPVELIEQDDGQLAASDPNRAIKQMLEFVVDELAAIVSSLPRRLQNDEEPNFIEVLPKGDDLLAKARTALRSLIDAAKSQQMGQAGWISAGYSRMISIVNKFRANETLSELEESSFWSGEHDVWLEASESAAKVSELKLARSQVKLLEHFEMSLKCQLERFFDFGRLIRLDCLQLNEQLTKIVERERSLIIRVHSDDICKLMESLRLQLDELEINIDLESALEDYLNKRWQIKQSQQPDLEQQILLDGQMDAELEMAEAELFHGGQQREQAQVSLDDESGRRRPISGPNLDLLQLRKRSDSPLHEDEEEFANALVSNNNPNIAHLFAMSNPNDVPLAEMLASGELGVGSRRLAPLVECRLLLGRYQYLDNFIQTDLEQFLQNVHFLSKFGLMFLTEFLPTLPAHSSFREQHLDTNQTEMISELALRTREFSAMLTDSLDRLEMARQKLFNSSKLRSNVMNRVCLEFDWLMQQLSSKRLNALRGTSDDLKNNIKHLDLIQETSTWALKLRSRLEFLLSQNELMQKEAQVLYACEQYKFGPFERLSELEANKVERDLELPAARCLEFEVRKQIVSQWGSFSRLAGAFWLLVEESETQQLKWLNSDLKKLDYETVKRTFQESFLRRLLAIIDELRLVITSEFDPKIRERYTTLLENMMELKSSFDEFSQKFLPIFKFLTNRHLTQQHWLKLSQLIDSSPRGQQVGLSKLQFCTTVAQLLELNVQEFVGQLDAMSHEATIEHELSSLILTETERMNRLARHSGCPSTKMQLEWLNICSRLDEWTEPELILATSRLIRSKLEATSELQSNLIDMATRDLQINRLAKQLVTCHSSIRRFLALSGHLNLITCTGKSSSGAGDPERQTSGLIVLRTNTLLSSTQQVRASLLLEYVRLFTQTWIAISSRMARRLNKLQRQLERTQAHLADIEELLERVRSLTRSDLQAASQESELQLSQLQRRAMKLELEREILSTREASALEKQRQALKARDTCIRQISERIIPAIRASSKALDCLGDGRSLRALRSYRPKPPLAIRLVIEAVCLLRNACCSGDQLARFGSTNLTSVKVHLQATSAARYPTSPQRHFDSLRGQIVEDYWPIACRTLNGLHSSKFIAELRQVSKRTIPRQVIHLIRRKYLSRPEFQVDSIERISHETGLLARYLIAVDVFDRVINIVKPNYEQYLNSERSLSELLEDVAHKRQQINAIDQQLEQMNEQIGKQISRRAGLVDLIEDCSKRSQKLERTKLELEVKRSEFEDKIQQAQQRMQRLAKRCLWQTARLVYLEALPCAERRPIERILRALIRQLEFN